MPTYQFNLPSRPMLARDADSIYWMARYVERAEHIARLMWVTSNLLVDVGDLAPAMQDKQWLCILSVFHVADTPPGEGPMGPRIKPFMALSADNPGSIYSCITRARENARGIRELISSEMWESLNTMYWTLRSDDTARHLDEAGDDFFRSIMVSSLTFQGLVDQTITHDQRWLFAQLGKYLERVVVTCRVIESKWDVLHDDAETASDSPLRNIHWMAVLRSCCSIEAYRRIHVGDMDPVKVAGFLLMEMNFPRSVRHCVHRAHDALTQLRKEISPLAIDDAERVLGRLDTQLEYAEIGEVLAEGLPNYLRRIQGQVSDAAMAVQKAYFLH